MQTSPAVEQIKTLNGPRVHGISPVGKEKVYCYVLFKICYQSVSLFLFALGNKVTLS